jgi:hypothetical protein
MHVGVACQPDLTISVHLWNQKHVSVHLWKWKPGIVHSWKPKPVSVHSWKQKPVSVHLWNQKYVSVHSWKPKHVSVHSWKQKHVSRSIAAFIVVSLGYGSRLLTERAEVVGGLTAAAGAKPYRRPRVRLPRWAGCAAAEMH